MSRPLKGVLNHEDFRFPLQSVSSLQADAYLSWETSFLKRKSLCSRESPGTNNLQPLRSTEPLGELMSWLRRAADDLLLRLSRCYIQLLTSWRRTQTIQTMNWQSFNNSEFRRQFIRAHRSIRPILRHTNWGLKHVEVYLIFCKC